jgi:hypothetical protein
MKKTFIIVFILLFSVSAQATSIITEETPIMMKAYEKALETHKRKMVFEDGGIRKHEVEEIVYWLHYYSEHREVFKNSRFDHTLDYPQLWKDSLAIVWEESWFVNVRNQDNGTGFGWGALQWGTAEDNANRLFNWDWENEKKALPYSNQLQAKYVIGHLLYLQDYYGNRRKAILGYNMGMNIHNKNPWDERYWLKVSIWRRQIDDYLRQP